MENILKQAKSDIFKELYPIITFYIKKGAKPSSLKKYYNNSKRFFDLIDDIKSKGVNLVKNEEEYFKLVREILNDILDDCVAKEKDNEYKIKQQTKMKHIKEFYSFKKINEGSVLFHTILNISTGIVVYKFIKHLFNESKRKRINIYDNLPSDVKSEFDKEYQEKLGDIFFKKLNIYVDKCYEKGEKVKFSENIIYYIFEIEDLIIKINKNDNTIKWSKIEYKDDVFVPDLEIKDSEDFTYPTKISQEIIDGLISGIKEDIEEENKII